MTFLLTYWRIFAIAAALAAATAFGAYRMHVHDQIAYDALRSEFDTFRGGVEALGKAAQERTIATETANAKRKQDADAQNRAAVAALNRSIAKLRLDADRARSRGLPAAPAASSRPDLACFDRAEFEREDGILTQRLLQGARGIADEGSAATVNLNSAKAWAQGR